MLSAIIMSADERHEYFMRLAPYFKASLGIFGIGLIVGLIMVARFPELAEHFQASLAGFVKIFHGMPKLQLAAAIFFNNAIKTVAAMILGCLFGVVPGFLLFANGAALGLVFSLSTQTRGLWISLLSILPHGVLELAAVFFGTSIGLMLGTHAIKSLYRKNETTLGAELLRSLRFFCTVIAPLLLIAAFVEAFLTAALVSPK
jgi:stage II sporulation protein M